MAWYMDGFFMVAIGGGEGPGEWGGTSQPTKCNHNTRDQKSRHWNMSTEYTEHEYGI